MGKKWDSNRKSEKSNEFWSFFAQMRKESGTTMDGGREMRSAQAEAAEKEARNMKRRKELWGIARRRFVGDEQNVVSALQGKLARANARKGKPIGKPQGAQTETDAEKEVGGAEGNAEGTAETMSMEKQMDKDRFCN